MAIFTDIEHHVQALHGVIGADAEPGRLLSLVMQLTDDQVISMLTETAALIRATQAIQVVATGVAAVRSVREAGHSGLAQVRGKGSVTSLLQDLTGVTRSDAVKQVRAGESLASSLADVGQGRGGDMGEWGSERDGEEGTTDGGGADSGGAPGGAGTAGGDGAWGEGGAGGSHDAGQGADGGDCEDARGGQPTPDARRPWHARLDEAVLTGLLSTDQSDAIRRGLGQPPIFDTGFDTGARAGQSTYPHLCHDDGGDDDGAEAMTAAEREQILQAWESAATQLINEAGSRRVEDLGAQARAIRDLLDPEGARRRFEERYRRRTFRTWRDRDGVTHGSFLFDDEGALWVKTILDTALAPRRGVRFVDDTEKSRARELIDDPRTTDQLAYDLAIDLLRAGALADSKTVFGTRQAGVRILIPEEAAETAGRGEPAVAASQDDMAMLPGWLAAQHRCDVGFSRCVVDPNGNPLALGRGARLFTPKQKLALAIRDGGCRWPGCDRPAHYCEAHHANPWSAGGATDVDCGILLCRFHHGQLHHGGWWISRHGKGDFILHPPEGAPIVLTVRLARQYLFRSPAPPRRFRPAA